MQAEDDAHAEVDLLVARIALMPKLRHIGVLQHSHRGDLRPILTTILGIYPEANVPIMPDVIEGRHDRLSLIGA